MLLPLQGANPNIHRPRALPWARCLLAFQAVTSQKLYRTPIIFIFTRKAQKYTETLLRMLFCESLRRLRETIPLRTALVKID